MERAGSALSPEVVPSADPASRLSRWLEVFQIADSTFPIGTFNHSFGLENYIWRGEVQDVRGFEAWLAAYFRTQYLFGEGLLTRLVMEALDAGDEEALWRLDEGITEATVARETREGTRRVARQMLSLVLSVYGGVQVLDDYQARLRTGECKGNPAIVFAAFAQSRGLSAEETFCAYGYSIASTMTQNAVRAVPLGQRAGQEALHRTIALIQGLWQRARTLPSELLGANVPGLELAQIAHETQGPRLFMS